MEYFCWHLCWQIFAGGCDFYVCDLRFFTVWQFLLIVEVLLESWCQSWINAKNVQKSLKSFCDSIPHVLSRKDESSFMRLSIFRFPISKKTSLNFWANIFRGAGVRQMNYVSKSGSNWGCSENPMLFLSWSMVTYIMSYQSQFLSKSYPHEPPRFTCCFGSNCLFVPKCFKNDELETFSSWMLGFQFPKTLNFHGAKKNEFSNVSNKSMNSTWVFPKIGGTPPKMDGENNGSKLY